MISLFVPGAPEAQARPRSNHFGAVYSPKTEWNRKIISLATQHYWTDKLTPLDCALSASIAFRFPRPSGISKRQIYKITKPDGDNLTKPILDGLEAARWFVNDSRVARMVWEKVYTDNPQRVGAEIYISELDNFLWKLKRQRKR